MPVQLVPVPSAGCWMNARPWSLFPGHGNLWQESSSSEGSSRLSQGFALPSVGRGAGAGAGGGSYPGHYTGLRCYQAMTSPHSNYIQVGFALKFDLQGTYYWYLPKVCIR